MGYGDFSPMADKFLLPDGSITTFDNVEVSPANAARALLYAQRASSVAKWLMPDGSIVSGLPVVISLQPPLNYIGFDTTPQGVPTDAGTLAWDEADKTLSLQLDSTVKLQIGQEQFIRVVNKTGNIITNGSIVYVNGAQGNRPTAALADANSYANSQKVIGMVTADIAINGEGYVTISGIVRDLNTKDIVEGTCLYLSETPGQLTAVKPADGVARILVGMVVKEHVSDGWVCVRVHEDKYMFGDVDNTNYSYFEENGTLIQKGTATTWEDVLPNSVNVGTSGANVPSFTAYNGNLKAYEFLGVTNMKEINLGFQLPHKRKPDSHVDVHLHLYIPSGSAGVVKFGCEYTLSEIGSTGSLTPTTIYGTVNVADSTIYNNVILAFPDIPAINKGISAMLMVRIFRNPVDAEDTFSSSVWLKSADMHIESDRLGSNQEYIL